MMTVNNTCAYQLQFDLRSFCELSPDDGARVVRHLVAALRDADIGYLAQHPDAPTLYASGVKYCADGHIETQWYDIPAVIAHGCADCKALAAWRWAEIPRADLHVTYTPEIGYHIALLTRDGIEDPSMIIAGLSP